ncbi:MAG: ATPase, partial [Oscillospiraceae bacterium]|nr:ATPase [Oscillospiraceae bacterium]
MDLTRTALGIELGSTRIKAVLIDESFVPVASGDYEWENQLVDGIWTYPMDAVHSGLQTCFARLRQDVKARYGVELTTVGAIGVSAMMHGYLPFDRDGRQLAEFRTWRNTITGPAAEELTALFGFNIPQRWSIAHLYQAILNGEEHVKEIAFLTTLAGYIPWQLTGEKVMGVGEASGMFPIDSAALDYDEGMVQKFNGLTGLDLRAILP